MDEMYNIESLYKLIHDNIDIKDVENRMLIDFHMEIYGEDY